MQFKIYRNMRPFALRRVIIALINESGLVVDERKMFGHFGWALFRWRLKMKKRIMLSHAKALIKASGPA